uniref:Uncharacterized protein n=1 Tax=Caenorhabditis japonica TaxID=281687 RepID=A0A8R1IQJ8_CAEJA
MCCVERYYCAWYMRWIVANLQKIIILFVVSVYIFFLIYYVATSMGRKRKNEDFSGNEYEAIPESDDE